MKQQGAALVIVLALLAGSLMIGVSGMNSALIDERLAGNYRASVQAQMNAEKAAALGVSEQNADSWEGLPDFSREELSGLSYADVCDKAFLKAECTNNGKNRFAYGYVAINGNRHVFALGEVYNSGGSIAKSFIYVEFGSQTSLPDDLEEIKNIFDEFGILAGREIDVDNDEDFSFKGKFKDRLYFGVDFDKDEDDSCFKDKNGECFEEEKNRDDGAKDGIPDVPFEDYLASIKDKVVIEEQEKIKDKNLINNIKEKAIEYSGDCQLSNTRPERSFCVYQGKVDFDESMDFSNVTIVADRDIDFESGSTFKDVTIVSEKEKIDFEESATFENVVIAARRDIEFGDESDFKNATIVSEKEKIDFKDRSTFKNVSIAASRDIEFGDESGFKNTAIVSEKEKIDFKKESVFRDVSISARRDIGFGDESEFNNANIVSEIEKVDFKKGSIFEDVNIAARRDIDFGDESYFKNVNIVSEIEGIDFKKRSTFEDVNIAARRDIKFEDDSKFSNANIISRENVEIDDALLVSNVVILAGRNVKVEIDSEKDASGWFYAGEDIEVDIEEGNRFEGSLVAKGSIDFETEEDFEFNYKPTQNFLDILGGGDERLAPVSWGN